MQKIDKAYLPAEALQEGLKGDKGDPGINGADSTVPGPKGDKGDPGEAGGGSSSKVVILSGAVEFPASSNNYEYTLTAADIAGASVIHCFFDSLGDGQVGKVSLPEPIGENADFADLDSIILYNLESNGTVTFSEQMMGSTTNGFFDNSLLESAGSLVAKQISPATWLVTKNENSPRGTLARHRVPVTTTPFNLAPEHVATGKVTLLDIQVDECVIGLGSSSTKVVDQIEIQVTNPNYKFKFNSGVKVNGVGDNSDWIKGGQHLNLRCYRPDDTYPAYHAMGVYKMVDEGGSTSSGPVVLKDWTTVAGGVKEDFFSGITFPTDLTSVVIEIKNLKTTTEIVAPYAEDSSGTSIISSIRSHSFRLMGSSTFSALTNVPIFSRGRFGGGSLNTVSKGEIRFLTASADTIVTAMMTAQGSGDTATVHRPYLNESYATYSGGNAVRKFGFTAQSAQTYSYRILDTK